jgi:ParB-like chromosome segregation protein Spo0J
VSKLSNKGNPVKSKQPVEIKLQQSGNKFLLVPLQQIEFAERDAESLFYNPRSLERFSSSEMDELRESIRIDGLLKPPTVRAWTCDTTREGKVVRVQNVAGERRLRAILQLHELNAPCFDDETGQMVNAQKLYESVSCKVFYNITDEHALRLAFKENNEHAPLSIEDEIKLVERLLTRGLRQEQIVSLLDTNPTWVSQTASFKRELPAEAFQKLVDGRISRHVAVQVLSYRPEDRERLYAEATKLADEEHKGIIKEVREQVEFAEDLLDVEESRAERATSNSDKERLNRKTQAATNRLAKAQQRESRAKAEQDQVKQGHLAKASQLLGITPKKAKILTRQMIEQFYVDLIAIWLKKGKKDPVTNETYPEDTLRAFQAAGRAILSGQHDTGQAIRQYLVEEGIWQLPEGYEEPKTELLDIEADDNSAI